MRFDDEAARRLRDFAAGEPPATPFSPLSPGARIETARALSRLEAARWVPRTRRNILAAAIATLTLVASDGCARPKPVPSQEPVRPKIEWTVRDRPAWNARAAPAAWQSLLALDGISLCAPHVARMGDFVPLVKAILPGAAPEPGPSGNIYPWMLRNVSCAQGQKGYALLEYVQEFQIPGSMYLRVSLFDVQGIHQVSELFPCGWRKGITNIEFTEDPGRGVTTLNVATEYDAGGDEVVRQVYAFGPRDMFLIRIEDRLGRAVRNNYRLEYSNGCVGPRVRESNRETFRRLEFSEDPVEVLAALVWFSGIHTTIYGPPYDSPYAERREGSVASQDGYLSRARRRLLELAQSADPWIREYARLALEPVYGPT